MPRIAKKKRADMLSVQKKELSVKKPTKPVTIVDSKLKKNSASSSSTTVTKKKKKKRDDTEVDEKKQISSASSTKSSTSVSKNNSRKSSTKKSIDENVKPTKPSSSNRSSTTNKMNVTINIKPKPVKRNSEEKIPKSSETKQRDKTERTKSGSSFGKNSNDVGRADSNTTQTRPNKPAKKPGKSNKTNGIAISRPEKHQDSMNSHRNGNGSRKGPTSKRKTEEKQSKSPGSGKAEKPKETTPDASSNQPSTDSTAINNETMQNVDNKPPRPPGSHSKSGKVPLPRQVKHQDSMNLYRNGYGLGKGLTVTKSSTDNVEKNSNGRPIFHLPLNLNDSTTSFLGSSPGFLEMSSGLLPHVPQNKYNFRISLDDTNDTSQTANMLRNYIFDENDDWDSQRTEPAHIQKQPDTNIQDQLKVPSLGDEAFDHSGNTSILLNQSTETTSRSFGRTSTRLSFLYNKNIGLLCKNCFATDCDHMEKFNTLATPKLKRIFKGSESSEQTINDDSFDDPELYNQNNQLDMTTESMRLIDINDFNHEDTSSGEKTIFRQINMEHEAQFETSTPNGDINITANIKPPDPNNNDLNLSGSMLRYTPGIMNQSSFPYQQPRPNTNDSLKYDSDYDDDSYLRQCHSSASNTFETLDINSGVFFSNTEEEAQNNNKKNKSRKISLSVMPELPTVFEEKSAPNSAVSREQKEPQQHQSQQTTNDALESGLQELLETVYGNLANMMDEIIESDSPENKPGVNNDASKDDANTEQGQSENINEILTNKEEDNEETKENSDVEKTVALQTEIQCSTPLEKQGIFKRINDENEEKYIEQLKEDQLQAWLQANRKFTFEKDHFCSETDNMNEELLDTADEEVLEINTPEWVEKPASAETKQEQTEKSDDKPSEQQPLLVDSSTQADIIPSPTNNTDEDDRAKTPQTGDSSLPKTQGSYRQIDLLVLDHSRDERLIQENRLVEAINHVDERDVDSGVHSVNTERSEGAPVFHAGIVDIIELLQENEQSDEPEDANAIEPLQENEQLDEPENANDNAEEENNQGEPLSDPMRAFMDINYDAPIADVSPGDIGSHPEQEPEADSGKVHLPAITNKHQRLPPSTYYDNEILRESPFYNRLMLHHTMSSPFSVLDIDDSDLPLSQRSTVSPILDHHLKMAQYHKERVEFLTPLYSSTHGTLSNRYGLKPRLPVSRVQHSMISYRRRLSAGSNSYCDQLTNNSDFLDNLSEISPRSRPYVPHPPSYDRSKRIRHFSDPEPRYHWRNSPSVHSRTRSINTENNTSLYLTTPYRSVYKRQSQNFMRDSPK